MIKTCVLPEYLIVLSELYFYYCGPCPPTAVRAKEALGGHLYVPQDSLLAHTITLLTKDVPQYPQIPFFPCNVGEETHLQTFFRLLTPIFNYLRGRNFMHNIIQLQDNVLWD